MHIGVRHSGKKGMSRENIELPLEDIRTGHQLVNSMSQLFKNGLEPKRSDKITSAAAFS